MAGFLLPAIIGGAGALGGMIAGGIGNAKRANRMRSFADSLQGFQLGNLGRNVMGPLIAGQDAFRSGNLMRAAAATGGSLGAANMMASAENRRVMDSFLTQSAPTLANISLNAANMAGQARIGSAAPWAQPFENFFGQIGMAGMGIAGQELGFQRQQDLLGQLLSSQAPTPVSPTAAVSASIAQQTARAFPVSGLREMPRIDPATTFYNSASQQYAGPFNQ